jgi:hypothetical protein
MAHLIVLHEKQSGIQSLREKLRSSIEGQLGSRLRPDFQELRKGFIDRRSDIGQQG